MMSVKPLPGSVGVHLPAFKRKRIEQWCEDVAQYLKAGSLCRSVLGHTLDDNRIPTGTTTAIATVKSAPAGINQRTTTTATIAATTTTANTTSAVGTMAEMLSLNNNNNNNNNNVSNRKESGRVNANNGLDTNPGFTVTKMDTTAPPPGRGTPMPDTTGPLPVVKFSYGHYNEQRRRIDRLVQGLPVLSASASATPNPGSALDRLTGTPGGGAVIYVSGEEPARAVSRDRQGGANSPSRVMSPSPGPGPGPADPRSASRSSSGEPRARQPRNVPNQSRHPSVSPSPTRQHPHPATTTSSSHPHHNNKNNKMSSNEIVVIEDDYHHHNHPHHHHHHNSDYHMATGFRGLNFDGSSMLKRTPSQKVSKARQRMLAGTRRSRDPTNHVTPAHVPVQSCWAMAELTW